MGGAALSWGTMGSRRRRRRHRMRAAHKAGAQLPLGVGPLDGQARRSVSTHDNIANIVVAAAAARYEHGRRLLQHDGHHRRRRCFPKRETWRSSSTNKGWQLQMQYTRTKPWRIVGKGTPRGRVSMCSG
jgi:hypothetical protein